MGKTRSDESEARAREREKTPVLAPLWDFFRTTGGWKLWGKRALIGGALLLGAFLAGVSVWTVLPMEEVSPARLVPPSACAVFSVNVDRGDPVTAEIFSMVRERIARSDAGFVKKAAARAVVAHGTPRSVAGMLAAEEGTGNPEVVIVLSMGKIVKALKLFAFPLNRALFHGPAAVRERVLGHRIRAAGLDPEGLGPAAYTFVGNNLVLSSSLPALEAVVRSFGRGRAGETEAGGTQRYLAALLLQALERREGFLYADNGEGGLSAIIGSAEKKYAFAAFPAIDAVGSIEGSVSIGPDVLAGRAVFHCRDQRRIEDVRSDVKFLYGAARRVLRAQDLDMKGEILQEGNSVSFDFQVPGFLETLLAPKGRESTSEQGEKE